MCHFAVPHLHIGVENTRFWTLSWEWAHLCHGTLGSAVHKDSRMHTNGRFLRWSQAERERERAVSLFLSQCPPLISSLLHYITYILAYQLRADTSFYCQDKRQYNIAQEGTTRTEKQTQEFGERKRRLIVLVNAHLFYPRYPWQLCSTRMKIETFVSCLYIFSRGFNIQHSAPLLISNTERWQLGKLTAPKTHQ